MSDPAAPDPATPSDTPAPLSSAAGANMPAAADPHADKYSDPRVQVTSRGIAAVLIAIFIVGAVVAVGSILARRTRLEKTTAFWGPETITALQLADQVHLIDLRNRDDPAPPIELTAMPGLGHLRRALLDERHYDWSTRTDESGMAALCRSRSGPLQAAGLGVPADSDTDKNASSAASAASGEAAQASPLVETAHCVQLRFADPTLQRVPETTISLELTSGFVGPAGGSRRVRMNARVRPALRHQLNLLMNFQQKRYDARSNESTP